MNKGYKNDQFSEFAEQTKMSDFQLFEDMQAPDKPFSPIYEPVSPAEPPPTEEPPAIPSGWNKSYSPIRDTKEVKRPSVRSKPYSTSRDFGGGRGNKILDRRTSSFVKRPKSKENSARHKRQVFNHSGCMAVLAIRGNSYTLTNGFVSYVEDFNNSWESQLISDAEDLDIGRLYVVDVETKDKWKEIRRGRLRDLTPILLTNVGLVGKCSFCSEECHRWRAVIGGIQKLLKMPVEPIRH